MFDNYTTHPEIKSLSQPATKLLVLIHGLGSDGHDLISLVPFFQKDLPNCHFIAPHGIEPFDMAPYGRQWFSLNDRSPMKIIQLVTANIPLIWNMIKQKQEELNLTNKDTIFVGFSQGTMVALYLALIQQEPLNCVVGFSGRLILPPQINNSTTPICLIHGEADQVIEVTELDNAVKYFDKRNIKYQSLKIPNLSHSIDGKGIDFAIKFIKNIGDDK